MTGRSKNQDTFKILKDKQMKRLLEITVLFVIFCVSVPSYGYFLIYNLSGSLKGENNDSKASIPWKGYLVFDINDSNSSLLDVNLIMCGKDSSGNKVYAELGKRSSGNYTLTVTRGIHGNFWNVNMRADTNDFDFDIYLIGTISSTNIGLANQKEVSGKMAGPMMDWKYQLFDPNDEVGAAGSVTASLFTAATKYVNANNWTLEQVINTGDSRQQGLIQALQAKGCRSVTLAEP